MGRSCPGVRFTPLQRIWGRERRGCVGRRSADPHLGFCTTPALSGATPRRVEVQVPSGQQGRKRLVLPRKALHACTWQTPVAPTPATVIPHAPSATASWLGREARRCRPHGHLGTCTVPVREPAECPGEESSGFCALGWHPPAEPQNPVLAASGSIGRPWKLATREAAMWSGLEPL